MLKQCILSLNYAGIFCVVSVYTTFCLLIDCPLVLLDLCLFTIAVYLKALSSKLEFDENELLAKKNSKQFRWDLKFGRRKNENLVIKKNLFCRFSRRSYCDEIEELKINAKTFEMICKTFSQLKEIFSVPVLFLLTVKFTLVITSIFVLIFSAVRSDINVGDILPLMFYLSLSESIKIVMILSSSEMPFVQVNLVFLSSYFSLKLDHWIFKG